MNGGKVSGRRNVNAGQ